VTNIKTLATLDEESAKESMYALPRAGKPIVGPSARFAEIVFSQWGNAKLSVRVTDVDRVEKFVEAEAVFHDLETNAVRTARVRRRISEKNGRVYNDDMILVTGNAAASIAARNATLAGIPKAVWRGAYAAVEQVVRGDVKTLSVRRDLAMKAFAAFGVKPEQVFAALEVKGMEDVTLDHLVDLTAMHASLKSGEADVEAMFPTGGAAAAGDKPKTLTGKLDQIAGSKDKPADPPAAEDGNATKVAADKPTTAKKAAAKVDAPATADKAPAAAEKPADEQKPAEAKTAAPAVETAPTGAAAAPAAVEDKPAAETAPEAETSPPAEDGNRGSAPAIDSDDDPEERIAMMLEGLPFAPKGIDADDLAQVAAYVAGAEASAAGKHVKSIPVELKAATRSAEGTAWKLGYQHQTEHEAANPSGE